MFDPAVYIYDNYPGGIGLSRPLYEVRDQVLAAAADLIRACGCEEGCPSCVGTFANGSSTKEVTLVLLELLRNA